MEVDGEADGEWKTGGGGQAAEAAVSFLLETIFPF